MPKILIIDDSPTEVYLLQNMVEKHGFETVVANSGEEGIQQAIETQPDAIIMDIVMPGMSGFQATRRLSKDAQTANIPVVIVTTKDQETDRIWGLRQGAVDYIMKPVKEQELVDKLRAAIG
ncbi:MAG TPA: response regulator [Gammaproteobacteria bacterium]|nr:response regulator [Gammaproteobacteria bacterium]